MVRSWREIISTATSGSESWDIGNLYIISLYCLLSLTISLCLLLCLCSVPLASEVSYYIVQRPLFFSIIPPLWYMHTWIGYSYGVRFKILGDCYTHNVVRTFIIWFPLHKFCSPISFRKQRKLCSTLQRPALLAQRNCFEVRSSS